MKTRYSGWDLLWTIECNHYLPGVLYEYLIITYQSYICLLFFLVQSVILVSLKQFMACCSLSLLFPHFVITILFHLPVYNTFCLSFMNLTLLISDCLSNLVRSKSLGILKLSSKMLCIIHSYAVYSDFLYTVVSMNILNCVRHRAHLFKFRVIVHTFVCCNF